MIFPMKLRFPHPLTLMVAGIVLAAVLTHVLPAGSYDRREDPATGKSVVVAGSYKPLPGHPMGFFETLEAIPKGMLGAGSVVFFVFLVGGAFTVVDKTGALQALVDSLVKSLGNRGILVIPILGLAFAAGGALENMEEEILAFVPVLLLLMRRLGFRPLTAVALSMGTAAVGSTFSPINPFQVGIAQKLAGLPLLSGWGFRLAVLIPALAVWIFWTMRWTKRNAAPAEELATAESSTLPAGSWTWRHVTVLLAVAAAFMLLVIGVSRWDWDFDQLAGMFFFMGVVAGVVGGLGLEGTAEAFVEGFRGMAYAGLLIGFARAIFVVMDDGHIVDTIVQALFTPLSHLPVAASAAGMVAAHTVIHFPVPSVSGQAVLTMPLLVPLSDLLGLSRQVTILAYQTGAGLCEMLTPTNGALMAMLAATGVKYDDWLRFLAPVYAVLLALGTGAVLLGIGLHW
jgi:uncharacterized ion transporter superfamily protein YfcC